MENEKLIDEAKAWRVNAANDSGIPHWVSLNKGNRNLPFAFIHEDEAELIVQLATALAASAEREKGLRGVHVLYGWDSDVIEGHVYGVYATMIDAFVGAKAIIASMPADRQAFFSESGLELVEGGFHWSDVHGNEGFASRVRTVGETDLPPAAALAQETK